jgi:hypothetical protein
MKSVLTIKLAFLAVLLLACLSALGYRRLGLDLAAILSVVTSGLALLRDRVRPMELGLAATLAVLALLDAAQIAPFGQPVLDSIFPALLLVWAIIGALSCLSSRPWTAVYAAAQYGQMKDSPVFHTVNMALSAMWSLFFLAFAAIAHFKLGAIYSEALIVVGILLSIFGPKPSCSFDWWQTAVRAASDQHTSRTAWFKPLLGFSQQPSPAHQGSTEPASAPAAARCPSR